jgi:hypothetical protein
MQSMSHRNQRISRFIAVTTMASGLAFFGKPTTTVADEERREPIVGGWEMTLSVGGTITDYIFEQFHSDGTEIENDITDVLSGNVCMGVWEKLRDGTYGVTHPSFNFYGYDIHPGGVLFQNPPTPPSTGLAGQSDDTLTVLFFRLTVSKDGQTLSGKMNAEACSSLDFSTATCSAPFTFDVSGKRIKVNVSQLPP